MTIAQRQKGKTMSEYIVREIDCGLTTKQEIVGELVRCKDCIFAHLTYDGECKYCDAWSGEEPLYLDGDFYCSFGEKVPE